ncbi:hypothetical protein AB1N83_007932 [Pleurotus pulmonarius]
MRKSLTPPPGTLYYKSTRFVVYDNEAIASNVKLSWQAEIHVYATGGVKPDDPDFESKGGAIHIVICHTGNATLGGRMVGDLALSCGADDLDSLPYIHLPMTGAARYRPGDSSIQSYKLDFKKTFQMVRGNLPLSFDAQYSDDFSLTGYTAYYADLDPAALQVRFGLHPGNDKPESTTDYTIRGVSGFHVTKPRKQISLWFYASQKTKEVKKVTIDLRF